MEGTDYSNWLMVLVGEHGILDIGKSKNTVPASDLGL